MNSLNHSAYIHRIRGELPRRAFLPAPKKLARMFMHLGVAVLGYLAFRLTSAIPIYFLLSIVIGHSLACIAFLAHELAHGAIIKARAPRYAYEFFFWALLLVPATVWRRVHNHTHHVHASTPKDPDRAFLRSEASPLTRWYTRIFYPNIRGCRWNPIIAFHFIPYIARNVIASFYPSVLKPVLVPAKPSYATSQHLLIIFELLGIVALQVCIFFLVGRDWLAYLWASPGAYLVTSSVTMTYIFTNHFLNPIAETSDPVLGYYVCHCAPSVRSFT